MKNLAARLTEANQLLAPYAVPSEGTLGTEYEEVSDATRFPFQRDRDRIIHSRSFRRLKGKTQVFIAGEGDHYRTRLTHTMEVAQISRDMARTLGLNEDLAESIALAHDLGHPPFGHAGEGALDAWMRSHRSSFEHNRQSLRVVTVLERHSSLYTGLNVHLEVLEGLLKHRTPFDGGEVEDVEDFKEAKEVRVPRRPSLEAQIVNIADEIAYTGHDCDDGLRAQLFAIEYLEEIALIQTLRRTASKRGTSLRGALIDALVSDLYAETERQITLQTIESLDDVYARAERPVRFSTEMRTSLDTLRSFLWQNMYLHPDVLRYTDEGKQIVTGICEALHKNPNEKIAVLIKLHKTPLHEAVKDYVAGMTDGYAKKHFDHS